MTDALDIELTRSDVARLFDVSEKMVDKLRREYGMPQRRRARFHLLDVVQWYVTLYRPLSDAPRPSAGGSRMDHHDARKRLVQEQTERERLRNAQTRRELVPIAEYDDGMQRLAVLLVSRLDGLGPRLANVLAGEDDARRITEIIRDECDSIRAGLADTLARHADDYRDTAQAVDTAEAAAEA